MFRIAPPSALPPDPASGSPSDPNPTSLPDPGPETDTDTPPDDSMTSDDSKTDQQASGYMGSDQGPFECENCSHFSAPNACQIVSGAIEAKGCCNLFRKATDADSPDTVDPTSIPMQAQDQDVPTASPTSIGQG